MAGFSLSPAVVVTERDLTSIIPAVSTSAGAFAGVFSWGPVMDPVVISSRNNLAEVFGLPTDSNYTSFFTAANFLSYSNNLLVNRVSTSGTRTACETPGTTPSLIIDNTEDYLKNHSAGITTYGQFAAKYPGSAGNGIRISYADSATFANWAYKGFFSAAPGTSDGADAVGGANDEIHVIIIDEIGKFTGQPGSILEKYDFLSKSKDSRRFDGTNNYFKDVLNARSNYVWWLSHPESANWGGALTLSFSAATAYNVLLSGGIDDYAATLAEMQDAYDLFANDELYDISLIPMGKAEAALTQYVIQNVAEVRKDCIVFASPETSTGEPIIGKGDAAVTDAKAYRTALNLSSSYGFLDSGWKYQYDDFNDVYRYIPLNGDIAGIAARTDSIAEPWFSPAGLNRGMIKNLTAFGFNPGKTERDSLYQVSINPCYNYPNVGPVLFGDKTLLSKPSAFDRINVRRLFIVLEKAIATAAKYQLFEINDDFTRAQFKNLVEPFLRDVRGRRGIYDFEVVCDSTNNTPEVIDRNEFKATIKIKPARSINVIYLDFVAARTGVSFSEVGAA